MALGPRLARSIAVARLEEIYIYIYYKFSIVFYITILIYPIPKREPAPVTIQTFPSREGVTLVK